MKVELLNNDLKYARAILEAQEVLKRVDMHSGEFRYSSQVFKDTMVCPRLGGVDGFKLSIRPQKKDVVVGGQPVAHQYVEMFAVRSYLDLNEFKNVTWRADETPIARFHFA